jgi:glycosyltransferase involved in cell wall biosynthesis
MKILLSAYACEPNKGSEPGVGWNWALELTKLGHDVWVLTRANNQHSIEKELIKYPLKPNLHFIYYDLPAWATRLKKLPGGIYFYYSIWQFGAYKLAKKNHARFQFDVVHHVTFVSIRLPSFMGNLGTRFIFGPLAGGEKAPWRLRAGFPFRGIFLDFLRDMGNFFIRFDPINHSALAKAETIYVTSQQTKALIPSKFRSKTKVKLAIGISDKWHEQHARAASEKCKILFVGRFLYWKGMHLGLPAIAEAAKQFPNIQLTMVGEGPEESEWKKQAQQLGLASKIQWIPWVSKQELVRLYQTHHLFLFPSLHDSGGMVVLEALAQGLPVICLDLGGPGVIIDESCGIKIGTIKKREKEIIKDISAALLKLLNDSDTLGRLQEGAPNKMSEFAWKHIINDIYQ